MRRCIRKLEGQNRRSKGSKEVNFFRPVKPTMTNGPLIGEFAVPNKIANIFKHRSGSPLFRSGGPLTGCSNMFCNDGKSLKNIILQHCQNEHTCTCSQCMKITEKVAFNIASEASYVYILSKQKFIENAKNYPFWRVFENLKLVVKQCYQPDRSILVERKLVENAKIRKIQMRHFG